MSDLIKREDAIKAIWGDDINPSEDGMVFEAQSHIDRDIKLIPSADRPQGEWIFKPLFPNDESEFPMGHLECSVCGSHHSNSTPCNYCDNCGADMRKGADDE